MQPRFLPLQKRSCHLVTISTATTKKVRSSTKNWPVLIRSLARNLKRNTLNGFRPMDHWRCGACKKPVADTHTNLICVTTCLNSYNLSTLIQIAVSKKQWREVDGLDVMLRKLRICLCVCSRTLLFIKRMENLIAKLVSTINLQPSTWLHNHMQPLHFREPMSASLRKQIEVFLGSWDKRSHTHARHTHFCVHIMQTKFNVDTNVVLAESGHSVLLAWTVTR